MDEVLSWEGGLPPHLLSLSNCPVAFKRHLVPAFLWRERGTAQSSPVAGQLGLELVSGLTGIGSHGKLLGMASRASVGGDPARRAF